MVYHEGRLQLVRYDTKFAKKKPATPAEVLSPFKANQLLETIKLACFDPQATSAGVSLATEKVLGLGVGYLQTKLKDLGVASLGTEVLSAAVMALCRSLLLVIHALATKVLGRWDAALLSEFEEQDLKDAIAQAELNDVPFRLGLTKGWRQLAQQIVDSLFCV